MYSIGRYHLSYWLFTNNKKDLHYLLFSQKIIQSGDTHAHSNKEGNRTKRVNLIIK